MNVKKTSRCGGFSLVQILISLVILSYIIFTTITIVNQNHRLSGSLSEDYILFHEVRAAVNSLENDISLMFILKPRYDFQNNREIFDAVFYGEKARLSAVTMNYQKMVVGQRDTNIREVEYYLVQDEDAPESEPSFSLMKKMTSFLDEQLFGEGMDYTVLTDLRSLSFKYYYEKQQTWVERWDSREKETKNLLPLAVAVEFEVYQRDPNRPERKPNVLFFETKFLADAAIETSRMFKLSQSVDKLKDLLKKSRDIQSGKEPSS